MVNHDLTPREAEAVRLLCFSEHTRNRDIARVMGISKRTVESFITHARDKTGARSRAELVQWGWKNLSREPEESGTGAGSGEAG